MAETGELTIPKDYKSKLSLRETEEAIKKIKDHFQVQLAKALNLSRVSAPLFLKAGTGVNDDLNGVERKAAFPLGSGGMAEAPNSLAKWKRMKLADYGFKVGEGLYIDMNGIRVDDTVDNLHSHYVDQWDWERAISKDERNLDFLKNVIKKIYDAIKVTNQLICEEYPELKNELPKKITFVNAEDLQREHPDLSPSKREDVVAKKYGAVFIRGIGAKLDDGRIHDGRAPDYDDWSTVAEDGVKGLNGDIVVYNNILERRFELSSMGIRVDKGSMLIQLETRAKEAEVDGNSDLAASYRKRVKQEWHKRLIAGEFPLSIGGGIGQSRLCMYLLEKAHIGEVQASVWPEDMIKKCKRSGINLL